MADAVAPTRSIDAAARATVTRGRVTASQVSGNTIVVDLTALAAAVRAGNVANPLSTAPESSRTLSAPTVRIGVATADPDAARIGLTSLHAPGRKLG